MRFHWHTWEADDSNPSLPVRRCERCGKAECYIFLTSRWTHAPELERNEMDSTHERTAV
jgi:hypothetical protein